MPSGTRWFGWLFLFVGIGLLVGICDEVNVVGLFRSPHLFMATIFGGLHLTYGIYLYFTEKKNPAA